MKNQTRSNVVQVLSQENRNAVKGGLLIGLPMAATLSHAAIDVTDVVTAIAAAGVAAALVGGAVLVMKVGIKVYAWIRGAM